MKPIQEEIPLLNLYQNNPEQWKQEIVSELKKSYISTTPDHNFFYTSKDISASYLFDFVHLSLISQPKIPFQTGHFIKTQPYENTIQEVEALILKDYTIFIFDFNHLTTIIGDLTELFVKYPRHKKVVHIDINTVVDDVINSNISEYIFKSLPIKNSTLSLFGQFEKLKKYFLDHNNTNTNKFIFDFNIDGRGVKLGELLHQIFYCFTHCSCKNIYVTVETDNDYFYEIAKLRALKFLAITLKSLIKNSLVENIFILASVKISATGQEGHYKVFDATTKIMSSLIGQADGVLINYSPSDPLSDKIYQEVIQSIPLVIQYESALLAKIDPSGGAFYVESLTQKILSETWELFRKSDI